MTCGWNAATPTANHTTGNYAHGSPRHTYSPIESEQAGFDPSSHYTGSLSLRRHSSTTAMALSYRHTYIWAGQRLLHDRNNRSAGTVRTPDPRHTRADPNGHLDPHAHCNGHPDSNTDCHPDRDSGNSCHYCVSGKVQDDIGSPLPGVTISDGAGHTAVSDSLRAVCALRRAGG